MRIAFFSIFVSLFFQSCSSAPKIESDVSDEFLRVLTFTYYHQHRTIPKIKKNLIQNYGLSKREAEQKIDQTLSLDHFQELSKSYLVKRLSRDDLDEVAQFFHSDLGKNIRRNIYKMKASGLTQIRAQESAFSELSPAQLETVKKRAPLLFDEVFTATINDFDRAYLNWTQAQELKIAKWALNGERRLASEDLSDR